MLEALSFFAEFMLNKKVLTGWVMGLGWGLASVIPITAHSGIVRPNDVTRKWTIWALYKSERAIHWNEIGDQSQTLAWIWFLSCAPMPENPTLSLLAACFLLFDSKKSVNHLFHLISIGGLDMEINFQSSGLISIFDIKLLLLLSVTLWKVPKLLEFLFRLIFFQIPTSFLW